MDPDKPGGKDEDRHYFAVCISRCLGYCESMVNRLVCGIQTEQAAEQRIITYFFEK